MEIFSQGDLSAFENKTSFSNLMKKSIRKVSENRTPIRLNDSYLKKGDCCEINYNCCLYGDL